MSDVRQIESIEGLADLRSDWFRLWEETPGASFFQTLEWLEVYWRHFAGAQRLRVLVVTEEGRVTGIVPLVVRRERTRAGPLRVLTYPLDDWASFYGPVGPDPAATLATALAFLKSVPPEWDALDLRWVDSQWATQPLEEAMRQAGFPPYRTVWDTTAVIDMDGSWESYLASRPAKWRHSFRRAERCLQRRGRITYIRYRPGGQPHGETDPRWDLFDACVRVAGRSWQGSSVTGTTLSHQSVRSFFRDAHVAAVRLGALDLNLLLVDGQPAAFAYNYRCGPSIYGVRIGFDPGVSRQGAGHLVCVYSVRDGFQRGDRLYDMGAGYLETKRHLATRLVPIHRLSHYRTKGPTAQLLRLRRWLQQTMAGQRGLAAARPTLPP